MRILIIKNSIKSTRVYYIIYIKLKTKIKSIKYIVYIKLIKYV